MGRDMSISSYCIDRRIVVILLLVAGMLIGLYVMNFQKQSSSVKADLGCSEYEVAIPIKNGINICSLYLRGKTYVVNPGNNPLLSTTFQCCKNPPDSKIIPTTIEAFQNIGAAVRDMGNEQCRNITGLSNAYCSPDVLLPSQKCKGTNVITTDVACGLVPPRPCCIPISNVVVPTTTNPPMVTNPSEGFTDSDCGANHSNCLVVTPPQRCSKVVNTDSTDNYLCVPMDYN